MRIVEYAVSHDGPIIVDYETYETQLVPPPLTRACHVLRSETLKLFFAKNEFCFTDCPTQGNLQHLFTWVAHMNVTSRWHLVKSCTIVSSARSVRPWVKDNINNLLMNRKVRLTAADGKRWDGEREDVRRFRLTVDKIDTYSTDVGGDPTEEDSDVESGDEALWIP